jgi:hypothetical protein
MSEKDWSEILKNSLQAKRFEPQKRLHDWYGHHSHRFPIKNGISAAQVMKENVIKNNALLNQLIKRGK